MLAYAVECQLCLYYTSSIWSYVYHFLVVKPLLQRWLYVTIVPSSGGVWLGTVLPKVSVGFMLLLYSACWWCLVWYSFSCWSVVSSLAQFLLLAGGISSSGSMYIFLHVTSVYQVVCGSTRSPCGMVSWRWWCLEWYCPLLLKCVWFRDGDGVLNGTVPCYSNVLGLLPLWLCCILFIYL